MKLLYGVTCICVIVWLLGLGTNGVGLVVFLGTAVWCVQELRQWTTTKRPGRKANQT